MMHGNQSQSGTRRQVTSEKDTLKEMCAVHACKFMMIDGFNFLDFDTVALSFLFEKHCSIIE